MRQAVGRLPLGLDPTSHTRCARVGGSLLMTAGGGGAVRTSASG
eukprot:SAG31_NODE_7991_length_1545_cov_19.856155_1_plen_43_part_10